MFSFFFFNGWSLGIGQIIRRLLLGEDWFSVFAASDYYCYYLGVVFCDIFLWSTLACQMKLICKSCLGNHIAIHPWAHQPYYVQKIVSSSRHSGILILTTVMSPLLWYSLSLSSCRGCIANLPVGTENSSHLLFAFWIVVSCELSSSLPTAKRSFFDERMQQLVSISTELSIKKIVSIILCKKKNNSRISSKVFLALDSWLGLPYQAWSPSDVADVTIVHNN